VELAEMMLRYANLPDDMEVTVIFDSFFPSESIIKTIKYKGYHFVCSVKSNRVDKDTGRQLKEICLEHISKGRIKDRVEIRVPSKRSRYNHPSAPRYETIIHHIHGKAYYLQNGRGAGCLFPKRG
jgi:hypothetical protein